MIIWRLIARYLRRHPGRSLLTLLSIAIGIAAVISVSLATDTTREAYRRMYEQVAGPRRWKSPPRPTPPFPRMSSTRSPAFPA